MQETWIRKGIAENFHSHTLSFIKLYHATKIALVSKNEKNALQNFNLI